jgi:hypothetical protein
VSTLLEMVNRGAEQLVGRASGPLHARLLIQPIVAVLLAVRAGMNDAKGHRPPFLWTVLTSAASRRQLLDSGWKDVSKLFLMAVLIDTGYQFFIFGTYYPLQALIVAFAVALIPYMLLRGLFTRVARALRGT